MSLMAGKTRKFIIKLDSLGYRFAKVVDSPGGGARQPNMMYASTSAGAWSYRPSSDNRVIGNCPSLSGSSQSKVYAELVSQGSTYREYYVCPKRVFGGQSDTQFEFIPGRSSAGSTAFEPSGNPPYLYFPSDGGYPYFNFTYLSPFVEAYYLVWVAGSVRFLSATDHEALGDVAVDPSIDPLYSAEYIIRTQKDTGIINPNNSDYHLYLLHIIHDMGRIVEPKVGISTTVPLLQVRLDATSGSIIAFAGWTYEVYRNDSWLDPYL